MENMEKDSKITQDVVKDEVTQGPGPVEPKSPTVIPKKKSSGKLIGVLVASLVVIVLVLGFLFRDSLGINIPDLQPVQENIVSVNGASIAKSKYDVRFGLITKSLAAQGQDITDPGTLDKIQEQIINDLVEAEVLLQAARVAGVSVTAEQVEERYQAMEAQAGGSEALSGQLAENNIDIDFLKADIEEQLYIQGFIENEFADTDFTVTDEEIDAFYAELSLNDPNIPPQEEIQAQLETALVQRKNGEAVDVLVNNLRNEAEVEILQ